MDGAAAYTWMLYYALSAAVMAAAVDTVLQRRRSAPVTWVCWAAIIAVPAVPVLAAVGTVMTELNQVLLLWLLQPVLCAAGASLLYTDDRRLSLQVSFYSSVLAMVVCGMVSVSVSQFLVPEDDPAMMRHVSIAISAAAGVLMLLFFRHRAALMMRGFVEMNNGRDHPFPYLTAAVTACVTVCYFLMFYEFGEASVLAVVVAVLLTVTLSLMLRIMFVNLDEVTRRARSEEEMRMSARIQESVLPAPDKLSWMLGFDVNARMVPAQEVGGDFYDWFRVSDRRVAFVVGDVSDKGVPSALFMMRAYSTIRDQVSSHDDLGEAMSAANAALMEDNPTSMFVTAFVAVLDLDDGRVSYVNAGHPAPVLVHGGRTDSVDGRSPFLGMKAHAYRAGEMTLDEGDVIAVFTDGVTEASDGETMFGSERVPGVLAGAGTPREATEALYSAVSGFQMGRPQADDITILSFGYRRTAHLSAGLAEDAVPECVGMVEDACSGLPSELSLRAQMATEELVGNIVDYAPAGGGTRLSVTLRTDAGLRMTIEDDGPRFDPTRHRARSRDAGLEERIGGGEGIAMARMMSDGMRYTQSRGRNILTVTFGPRRETREEESR